MALEDLTGTKYIDDLNSSNPAAGDNVSEGDDHIRGIKNVLKTTFPSIDGAVTATDTELNYVDGVTSAIQTQLDAITANNWVTTAKINADAVTGAKIADDAIDSEHYVNASIDNAHLADDSVAANNIVSGTITGGKIANDAIDSQHYADGSIDTAHYAADSVDNAALSESLGDLRKGITHIGRDANDCYHIDTNLHRWFLDGAEDMRLENDGDLHCEGDLIAFSTTISDATLKYNINPVEFALDKIKELKGVTFNYLKGNKESAGLLAQDVEKVMPSAVQEKKLPLHTDDDKSYKTLHYDSVTAILVEAIKELTAKVEKLENK